MNTIRSSSADHPTIAFSGGRGNTDMPEVHFIARVEDERGQTQTIAGWVDRDELLDAIADADEASRRSIGRLREPDVSE